jgi:hypothetical protein
MSYLHCPSCSRAYNLAAQSSCPYCPVLATPVDACEDIVAAAEQLARAMERATPAERGAAAARMERLALPAPDAAPAPYHGAMLRTIRDALVPARPTPTRPPPLLQTIALGVYARLQARREPKMLMDGLAGLRRTARSLFARA